MSEPRFIQGAVAPLFDRLAEPGLTAPRESRIQDISAIQESIVRDLSRLLNSRAPFRGPVSEFAKGTVLNYGVPDFSYLSPSSESDIAMLSAQIAERVARFEPRLSNVRVALVKNPDAHNSLIGAIYANLIVGGIPEPVAFPLLFDGGGKVIEIAASSAIT